MEASNWILLVGFQRRRDNFAKEILDALLVGFVKLPAYSSVM
jgi:hypothetical protein